MKKKNISNILAAAAFLAVLNGCGSTASPAASAAAGGTQTDWPQKTIQIIVPFKAGGDSDFNARAYAQFLEAELGQPVVVVNMDGSGGSVGSRQVKDAAPDGYTILSNHTAFLINQANGTSGFGFEEFELVGITAANSGDVVCVRADSGIKTLDDLKAKAKENPNTMTVSTTIGSTTQVSVEMLIANDIPLLPTDVGNAADKTVALLGGHVDVIVNPYGNVEQYIESGEFTALAVISRDERCPAFPDIPTAKEQGYDIYFPTRYFMAFPKGTDEKIVEKFRNAVKNIAENNKEYAKMIADAYYQEPFFLDQDDALEFYDGLSETLQKYSIKTK